MDIDLQRSTIEEQGGVTHLECTPGALGALLVACWGEYPEPVHGIVGARNGRLYRTILGFDRPATTTRVELPLERVDGALRRRGLELGAIYLSQLQGPATPVPASDQLQEHYPDAPLIVVSLDDPDEPDVRAWRPDPHHGFRELALRLAGPGDATQTDRAEDGPTTEGQRP